MAKEQITVREPAELVTFMDMLVESKRHENRASVIETALARMKQRYETEQDLEILRKCGDDPDDLDAMIAYTSRTPLDLD